MLWNPEVDLRDRPAGAKRAAIAMALVLGFAPGARAQTVDVSPQSLTRYAWCLDQARSDDFVWRQQRGIVYRCVDENAAGYYNELGRRGRHPKDVLFRSELGAFVVRPISGLGACWHQIEDGLGRPVSAWACDIFVAY